MHPPPPQTQARVAVILHPLHTTTHVCMPPPPPHPHPPNTHTRRFLLEWLSFMHRYIPVCLLEVLPQRMDQRPPPFVGR